MSRALAPTAQTIYRQALAAEPDASAWVAANAGSGKTTVLAHRVIRLMLAGVEPSRILCLTFTRAAAANMSNRIFRELAAFTAMDNAALAQALERFGVQRRAPEMLSQARRLFAGALDTPGGLKVLTLHAFCERVLHQFPLEAGVPADFSVLDEQQKTELVERARAAMLAEATAHPEANLGAMLQSLLNEQSHHAVQGALDELLGQRGGLTALLEGASLSRLRERLTRALGAPNTTAEALEARILDESLMAEMGEGFIQALAQGSDTQATQAKELHQIYAAGDTELLRKRYQAVFFTKTGEIRKTLVGRNLKKAHPHLADRMPIEAARIQDILSALNAVRAVERSEALIHLAAAVYRGYQAEKERRATLDFNDLIIRTRALLESGASAWVLYKLDGGIDHVLVDEAQDTSPDQWAIVRALTAEFTAGEGARGGPRTVFAVGDEKQSIYRFQGAAPEEFDLMRRAYRSEHESAGLDFNAIELTQSFRSADAVLRAVDAVFAHPLAHHALESDPKPTLHQTARPRAYGRVEVWPLVLAEPAAGETNEWDAPFDAIRTNNPVVRLAEKIADAVKAALTCGGLTAGDVLILLRSRSALFEAVIRALKQAALPVAGADRLVLNEHIAVLDLLALGDALLLEADDFALACVLKSPLFGFDDDDLIRIAPRREGTLRAALRDLEPAVAARLDAWEERARLCSPYAFYAAVLGCERGRHAFNARFGAEAEDVLDEFLRQAMQYSRRDVPTLAGFLNAMRSSRIEIKRDLDTASQDIRVMTVHGAKGLEAKMVILADTGKPPAGKQEAKIFPVREPGAPPSSADLLVWSPRRDVDPPAVAEIRAAQLEEAEAEHRRLLYVALTRAEDVLIVAGHAGVNKDGLPNLAPLSWYNLVRGGLEEISQEREDGTLVFEPAPPTESAAPASRPPAPLQIPFWLRTPAPREALPFEPVAPSRAAHVAERRHARPQHGLLVHGLLHGLADLPAADRADCAARYVRENGFGEEESREAVAEALAVLAHQPFTRFFGPDSRGEVPILADIGSEKRPLRVQGRVDRLVITPDTVCIVDFKTERRPPATAPDAYVTQLALYREALRRIFPQPVSAAILWTSALRLEQIPDDALDAAAQRIAALP